MRPLVTMPNGSIRLDVVRVTGLGTEHQSLYFGHEAQDWLFNMLRQPDSTSTPKQVFDEAKTVLERGNPRLDLRPDDLDVCTLADYIGFRQGLWANPYVQSVEYVFDPQYGFGILVPQGTAMSYTNVTVGINELRFIYIESKRGRTAREINEDLDFLHRRDFPHHTLLELNTVRRLRSIMRERIQEYPEEERPSWEKIATPYAENEMILVCDHILLPYKP